ncbi:uncharacterized protein BDV14DRAFT_16914 [Aspergillus stella-maris]|uniref:uncharacterized protein n=1 Tax=Aspergillus stella-maris TaxID=1810926 RepID=UPI003CCE097D
MHLSSDITIHIIVVQSRRLREKRESWRPIDLESTSNNQRSSRLHRSPECLPTTHGSLKPLELVTIVGLDKKGQPHLCPSIAIPSTPSPELVLMRNSWLELLGDEEQRNAIVPICFLCTVVKLVLRPHNFFPR